MKIYEYVEIDMDGNVIDEISHEYSGEVALCKGGGGTSTSTTSPPSWMQQFMPAVGERGWELSGQPMTYYPKSTTAGFTAPQLQAQQLTTQRALEGSPLLGQSQAYTSDVMGGKYLDINQNPALQNLMRQGLEQTMPGLDTQAMQAGRYGSDTWGLLKGQALADVAANVYNPERERQQAMAQYAPQLAQQDYFDIGKLSAVGEEQQAMNQANINEQISRHEFGQMEPWQRLGMFTNLLSGDWGGITTTQSSGGGK